MEDTTQPSEAVPAKPDTTSVTAGGSAEPPLSKNAYKRMLKRQAWEEGREERSKRRKEKRRESRVRKRTERQELVRQGADPATVYPKRGPSTLVPIALVLDCDFEQYMIDKERISLASQITRSYSDNQRARYKSHLWVNGWSGKLKERFETVLGNHHLNWRDVGFEEGDFLQAALKTRQKMQEAGGERIAALQDRDDAPAMTCEEDADVSEDPPLDPAYSDVIYLSSDSPYTLQRLEANKTYVIGGLVDKNRHKGLCHRRATEKGIRTARLPIGDFMVMQSRQVLATNHVVEIMLKWLEYEDWGEAFMSVIPKRKGGVLKGAAGEDRGDEDDAAGETSELGDEPAGGEDTEAVKPPTGEGTAGSGSGEVTDRS